MSDPEFQEKAVSEVFAGYPAEIRTELLKLRTLIFETAAATEDVGPLQETLKWGQPSYLTPQTKSGSTVRIDQVRKKPDSFAVYFHCQSGLVPDFRERYGDQLKLEGNRAILFEAGQSYDEAILRHCFSLALTHHLRKKKKR